MQTLRRLVADFPGRLAALLTAVFAAGFAFAPASILASKYLQQVLRYTPGDVTLLYVGGGLLSVAGNIFVGRLSDRFSRKFIVVATLLTAGGFFALLYSGIQGWIAAPAWIIAVFGFLSSDYLFGGYPAELFPTAYRATASTLRYVSSIFGGAISLYLEGVFYDRFGGHGPAIAVALLAVPVIVVAVLFLPETARRSLEEISGDHPA